jgi:hypothetical protein
MGLVPVTFGNGVVAVGAGSAEVRPGEVTAARTANSSAARRVRSPELFERGIIDRTPGLG